MIYLLQIPGGLRSPFFYGVKMDIDFMTGKNLFRKPEVQFKDPSLKGCHLEISNIDLLPLISNKPIKSILIDDICLGRWPPEDHRLIKADTSFPIWVSVDMGNGTDKPYSLIDGKHRCYRLKQEGKEFINAIVFSKEEILGVTKRIELDI